MATGSQIEWTDATWNPSVGCTKISAGCKNCYAATLHARLTEMGQVKYAGPFTRVRPWPDHLELPLHWRTPRMVFVNSMSDLFHESLPFEHVDSVFDVMRRASQHTFQVLTKRAAYLRRMSSRLEWPSNVWMGVSVEDRAACTRIKDLVQVPAAVRFLSVEPLLESIPELPLEGIHWVIVGGESGKGFRPMRPEWAQSIRDQCVAAGIPLFFKQWGGIRPKAGGNLLDRRVWRQFPPATRGRRKLASTRGQESLPGM